MFSNWLFYQEQGIPLSVNTATDEYFKVGNLRFLRKHYNEGANVGVVCGRDTGYVALALYSPSARWMLSYLSGNFVPTSMAWHFEGVDYILYNSCDVDGKGFRLAGVMDVIYDNTFLPLPNNDKNVKLNMLNKVYESPDWLNTLVGKDLSRLEDSFTSEALDWLNATLRKSHVEQVELRDLHRYYFVDNVFKTDNNSHPITYTAMKEFLIFLGFTVKNDKINATLIRR